MKGWDLHLISDLCNNKDTFVQTGPFGSQLHESDYSIEGVPVIMPKDIVNGNIDEKSIARVSESHSVRLKRHSVLPGDIVYGRRGDIGRHALIHKREKGWLCGTGCLLLRLNKERINSLYSHYYLSQQNIIDYIANQAIGATMPNLNTSILKRIPVYLPQIFIQRKIAAILSAYDDLIENNNRRIAILEKMAEELYREWFVRLRFPGHEKVKIVKGVPEGWKAKKLKDIVLLAYGKALKESTRFDGRVPVYGSSGIIGYHNQAICKGPGIIVGRKGNVGSIIWASTDFYPIDTTYYVISKYPLSYIYYLLRSMNFINNDAAVPGLNREQAYSNDFFLPEKRLVFHFSDTLLPLVSHKDLLQKLIQNLTASRDRLLSRLMSGAIDVENLDIEFPKSMQEEAIDA